jgi:predicted nucleic acid-binding protein
LLVRLAAEDRQVYLPIILLAKVASAISRGTGRPALARHLTAALQRVPNFEFVPVDAILGHLAAELAAQRQIRAPDAVYVALARQRGATLITLDDQQGGRVPPGVFVRTPAEELAALGR